MKKFHSMDLSDSFEKIPVNIFPDQVAGSFFVAEQIAALIKEKQKKKEKCVLGLATGFYAQNVVCRISENAQRRKAEL
ncbi:MAG: hypothetical protein WDN26_00580 [Chitinophagaceae bacterium]